MTTMVENFDDRACVLGEGPLWHPKRQQLFWFDILGKRLLTRRDNEQLGWQFDTHVSAAGWIDAESLLIASEIELFRFNVESGERKIIAPLEADNAATRSNDGRADPWGGFWIGTMGKAAEAGAGAIYRFYEGKVERLYSGITISNAICFSPDRRFAYYTDTPTRLIMRQPLDGEGWPTGKPEVFIDLREQKLNPDGAVVDAEGCLWNAQWGAARVARYSPEGAFLSAIQLPARQVTCPAFGVGSSAAIYVTSASEGLDKPEPGDGMTFEVPTNVAGQAEHRVRLD